MQPSEPESKLANTTEEAAIDEGVSLRAENAPATDASAGDTTFLNREEPPPTKAADSFVGTLLNKRFELLALVGEGGMSYVYKAKDVLLNKTFAVKMLRPYLLHDPNSIRRLHKEALAASALDHVNTAGIRHFDFTPDGLPFIVMDFLPGKSVAEILSTEGAIEPHRATRLIRQVAEALAHAHEKGIIHRDLKPSNVIVVPQGDSENVKVVDFGIAKLLTTDGGSLSHLTMTGEIFGSPIVMSPEQCRGAQVDVRSDVYSLGCLMYEMLTGRAVFQTTNTLELLFKQLNEMPDSFRVANPEARIPPELEAITFKAMQKDPQARYASMAELIADLDAIERKSVITSVVTRVSLAAGNKRRNASIGKAALLGTIVVSLLAAGGYFASQYFLGGEPFLSVVVPWQAATSQPHNVVARGQTLDKQAAAIRNRVKALASAPAEIRASVPQGAAGETQLRRLIMQLSADGKSLARLNADEDLNELSSKIDAYGIAYSERISSNTPLDNVRNVVQALTDTGALLFARGAFEQASCTYGAAQTITEKFAGPGCADDQYFGKLIGDCNYAEVSTGLRPVADYERALLLYDRVLPPRDDLRLVDRREYGLIDGQDFGATADLSISPLVWDAHRKRAECLYYAGRYAKALDDFDWISGHRLLKSLAPKEEALLRWQQADCQRVSLGNADEKDRLAREALTNYDAGRRWLPDADRKDVALSDAYVAAIADECALGADQLPANSPSLPAALAALQDAFGCDTPPALALEKQLARSLWKQGRWSEALKTDLDIFLRGCRWR